MKPLVLALASSLFACASASPTEQKPLADAPASSNQYPRPPPLGHLPIMVPPNNDDKRPSDEGGSGGSGNDAPSVAITDVLGAQRSISSFSSFSRLDSSLDTLLSDLAVNTTVLAPLNSAIDALPRKPWEDPREYAALGAAAYDGEDGQDRARRNLLRFVQAHLVAGSPWPADAQAETVLGGGRRVWWVEKDGGQRVIMPDGVEVERVASKVSNGEVWILRGVLNYE